MKREFLSLVEAVKDDQELLEFVGVKMNAFLDYVDAVVNMEVMQPIIYARYEGQDIRDRIQELDSKRRSKHEVAIAAAAQITRLSEKYHVTPMFNGDVEDRYQVADFCMEMVSEFFGEGQRDRDDRDEDTSDIDDYIDRALHIPD